MQPVFDKLLKYLLVGDQETGQSSIVLRYTDNTFPQSYISTIGVDFKIKTLNVMDKSVKTQIWDTAGQERFRTITSAYYKGASGIFLVFDFSNRQTFQNLNHWLGEIKKFASENVTVMLIGNKCDLINDTSVTLDEARKYAEEKKLDFFEVSAQQSFQIDLVFNQMAVKILTQEL